jgi:TonB-linked SusC/RagA family outer membrane protein
MKIKLLYFLFLCTANSIYAQQVQISGTVISSEDNFPIAGANILIQGKNAGTTTDFDGNYELSVENGDSIIISYLGFTSETILVKDQSKINVTLTPDNGLLDEIVVIGYGSQRKKEVTGAVVVIDAKAIEKLNPVRVEQALQGQISGVNVTTASGSPGSGANIRIRGVSTNGDSSPLILVDGNVITDLSVINPSDIKSVNVLKDATAGIYGVRAANGVILIVTKSGRKDSELKFTVDSYYGFQQTSRELDLLGPSEFAQYVNDSRGQTVFPVYPTEGTDWQNKVFETAPIANINFSANGGTKKSAYSFGVSYLNQDGIVGLDKSNFNRLTARGSYQYDVTSDLKINATLLYTHSEKNSLPEGGIGSILYSSVNADPLTNVIDNTTESGYGEVRLNAIEVVNPLAQINNTYNTQLIDKISATLGADYALSEKIKLSTKFQMNHAVVLNDVFRPEVYYGPSKSANVDLGKNEVTDHSDIFDDYTLDNYITYTDTFNEDHNLTVLLGTSIFRTQGFYYGNRGIRLKDGSNSFSDASIENIDPIDGTVTPRFNQTQKDSGADVFDSRLSSIFSRVQYNYKGKYLFSGIIRRDGSSKFGPENKFGYFPSGSVGWNISEEDFLQDSSWLSSLKLRASYGIIGNDRIPTDEGFISLLTGEATYTTSEETDESELQQGVAEGKLANPEIRWEKQKTGNIGFDAAILDNKITISVDAFSKETQDLLIDAQVSGLLGSAAPGSGTPFINAGTVSNKGVEFQIGYNDNFSDDFNFNVSYNFSTLENEVLFVESENGFQQGGDWGVGLGIIPSRMEAGLPLGYFYGYKTDGLHQTQTDIDALDATAPEVGGDKTYHVGAEPGDLKFVDINGDGRIDVDDKTYIGDPIADLTMGFNIGFTYKKIDFSASAFASIGNEMVRDYERKDLYANRGTYMLDRWTGAGTSTMVPRATSGASINTDEFSDFYVEDASFLRIQNIQVGYTFDTESIAKIGLDKLRLYVSANNLYTFTNYTGYDPGASSGSPIGAGIDKGFYPVAATFLLGVNLKF